MYQRQVIRERLRRELDRRNLSAVELARSAGVKTSFLYDILNGKSTNPSTVKLAQVAESLGVNLAYLAGTSDHPHLRAGSPPATLTDIAAIPVLAVSEAQTVTDTNGECGYFKRGWIRERLGCGPEQLRMFTLTGDGMAPTLHEGDALLVDLRRKSPSPPGVFLLFDGFGLVPKRLEYAGRTLVRVLSDNPAYGAYERPLAELQVIGRVVWFSRQL